jgi:hypothetical protein
MAEVGVKPAPDDHLGASPHCRVKLSASGRVGRAGTRDFAQNRLPDLALRTHRLDAGVSKAFQPHKCNLISITVTGLQGDLPLPTDEPTLTDAAFIECRPLRAPIYRVARA